MDRITSRKRVIWGTLLAVGLLLIAVLVPGLVSNQRKTVPLTGEIVRFPSGALTLGGVLYRPAGSGPFPAVLYNHGSGKGLLSNEAFEALAPVFTSRGWALFAPYRRGQGLSESAGPYILDEAAKAARAGGDAGWNDTVLRILSGDHLDDQMAALRWLEQQPYIQKDRVAVAGNSFGGIEVVFGAERNAYCAAIDSAGAAQSWEQSPQLQERMKTAVRNAKSPIFFIQAENDYDLSPSKVLFAEMTEAGRVAEMKIYPPFGKTAESGHVFGYFGSRSWASDVFSFLSHHCAGI